MIFYLFRMYIVMGIINNNVATEITHLQENMVALKNLSPSKNLAPTYPLIVHSPLSFENLAPKAIFFSAPPLPPIPPFVRGGGCILWVIRLQEIFKQFSRCLQNVFKTSCKDLFKASSRCFQDVLKMSSRCIIKLNCST